MLRTHDPAPSPPPAVPRSCVRAAAPVRCNNRSAAVSDPRAPSPSTTVLRKPQTVARSPSLPDPFSRRSSLMLTTSFGSIKESFLTQDLPAHCMSLINGLCLHECSDFLDSVVLISIKNAPALTIKLFPDNIL